MSEGGSLFAGKKLYTCSIRDTTVSAFFSSFFQTSFNLLLRATVGFETLDAVDDAPAYSSTWTQLVTAVYIIWHLTQLVFYLIVSCQKLLLYQHC